MMPESIYLYGPKGGQGVTTTAAMLALAMVQHGGKRVTVGTSQSHFSDLLGVLGLPPPGYKDEAVDVSEDLIAATGAPVAGLTPPTVWAERDWVWDGRTHPPAGPWALADDQRVRAFMVVRPCYLALRRAVTMTFQPEGIILIEEPRRALSARDVERVVGAPVVATIPFDAAISRAVDAGLLAGRTPSVVRSELREFVETIIYKEDT